MKHFYAIFGNYYPNSALANRMLAYFEAWSKMDVKVTAVFLLPDRQFSRLKTIYANIEIVYLWDAVKLRNYLVHNVLLGWYIRKFINKLKAKDIVYLYGENYLMSKLICCNKGIQVYQERTEHPLVVSPGHWPYKVSLEKYLQYCRRLSGLFVISQPLKDYFSKRDVPNNRIHIVNMIVDCFRFDGLRKRDNVKRYIAYCGNASNNKDGVDQLIKAFALVCEKFQDLYLYIIGKPPVSDEESNNAQLAEKLGIDEKVVFTGIVKHSEMPQMLTDACILALNRPYSLQAKHGFPTKLGEYLLTGNPVVVTRVGDVPRFLQDGVSAMIAEPDQPEQFASKLEWLLEHPVEASAMGERGKEVALINFNNEIEAKKIVDVLFNI